MSNKTNDLIKEAISLEVSGRGESENLAIEDAFRNLRKSLSESVDKPIITLTTERVSVKNVSVVEKEEAFLYVFSKRIRTFHEITLEVETTISMINLKGRLEYGNSN